jgi:hypothetical protein
LKCLRRKGFGIRGKGEWRCKGRGLSGFFCLKSLRKEGFGVRGKGE